MTLNLETVATDIEINIEELDAFQMMIELGSGEDIKMTDDNDCVPTWTRPPYQTPAMLVGCRKEVSLFVVPAVRDVEDPMEARDVVRVALAKEGFEFAEGGFQTLVALWKANTDGCREILNRHMPILELGTIYDRDQLVRRGTFWFVNAIAVAEQGWPAVERMWWNPQLQDGGWNQECHKFAVVATRHRLFIDA